MGLRASYAFSVDRLVRACEWVLFQTFETGLVSAASVVNCTGPLSNASASTCFAAGALLLGINYSASPGPMMALLGAGYPGVGNSSKVLGPNLFSDTLNMTFASADSVGFDFLSWHKRRQRSHLALQPDVLLGTFTFYVPAGPSFFGVVSDTGFGSIGRINVAAQNNGGELVDNVAFGNAAVPKPSSLLLVGWRLGCPRKIRIPPLTTDLEARPGSSLRKSSSVWPFSGWTRATVE